MIVINLLVGNNMRNCTFIFLLIFPNLIAKTYSLKDSEAYNGTSDMWVFRKETEVVTSSTNTFHLSFEASSGSEDTLYLENDIYRQS